MVRTKAGSVPGSYRKGEAVGHSSGGQVVLWAAPLWAGEERASRPVLQTGPFNRFGRDRGALSAVLDRGALLSNPFP